MICLKKEVRCHLSLPPTSFFVFLLNSYQAEALRSISAIFYSEMRKCISLKEKEKTMTNIQERISINPEIRFGKPCIKGTRIAVWDILGWLAGGMTYSEILENFPQLTQEDILASLAFAANREVHTKILITAA
jgi:uncharacterized protein (DUF433 family)